MSQPEDKFIKKALFLVDASSYIFRAYYAIQTALKAPDGTPTHATYGFLQMLLSLEKEYSAKHIVLIWDRPEKGFRHELFPKYKANRSAPPEDLGIQIENTKRGAALFGFPQLEEKGFEADDIIASFVKRFPNQELVVVTADKDLLQLVNPHVWCLDTLKKKWSNEKEAHEKFGVEPHQIKEIQALCGDSVDNIPGAPGVGPKTALELIQYFGSLDKILEEASLRKKKGLLPEKGDPLKGKRIDAIALNEDLIRISLKLVSLKDDLKIPCDQFEDFHKKPMNKTLLKEWSLKLGFHRFAQMASEGETDSSSPKEARSQKATHPFETHLVKNLPELQEILLSYEKEKAMALDTETLDLESRRSGNLVGISFCFREEKAFYIPLRHENTDLNLDLRETLKILEQFFKKRPSDFCLIFQNAKFDLKVLASEGLLSLRKCRIEDTLVQSYILDPSQAHGMDALSAKYLDYFPLSFKELMEEHSAKNFSQVPLERAAFYSAEDSLVTFRLWHHFTKLLKEEGLWKLYDEIDRPLIVVLTYMEENGIHLDPKPLQELSADLHRELNEKEKKARLVLKESGVLLEENANLGSPKQMAEILYEKLKLPIIKSGKTGPSTDVKVLEELSDLHPFCQILLEIREINKLLSTYVDALPLLVDPNTSRLHTEFSQTITATGRLSSSKPNLQNIPIRTERGKKIREAFTAAPGHVLVTVDYSQVELRLLANITRDSELLKAFQENADIHKRTAALIFQKEESQVTDDERRMAKTINFGIIYGQSAYGLSKTLKIPRHSAAQFIEDYFKSYPGIKEYIESSIKKAKDYGESRTLTGRRRPLPDIVSKNGALRQFAERMAINSPVQGLASDWIKAAMIQVHERLNQEMPQAKLVLQVHDELLFEVPSALKDKLRSIAVEIMEDSQLLKNFGIKDFPVKLKTESGTGRHWGEL